jgi:hypothetical protein
MTDNKMGGKYHTVGIILKSNRKLVKQSQNYTPNTHIHDRSFFLDWYRCFNKMWRG